MKWEALLLCWLFVPCGCSRHEALEPEAGGPAQTAAAPSAQQPALPKEAAQPEAKALDVQIEMKNVHLHLAKGMVLDVQHLRGVMVARTGRMPIFDDQRSYVLHILDADIAMSMASLQTLLNDHVLAYDGAPLEKIEVRAEEGNLVMKGKLHKGVDLPFSTKASVGITPDGSLRLHAESLKAAGVPAKGLMKLFGLELDDLVDLKQRRGVDVQDNDIVIAPGAVLPPPEIRGRLTRVAVGGDRLLLIYGAQEKRPAKLVLPAPAARNYVYFGSGTIRFGKLTMTDADLQLIDTDPRDPFEFDPARYNSQLVAGYSKNTPQKGLKTYMPDADDLVRDGRRRPITEK
jgi:hypothetical protein